MGSFCGCCRRCSLSSFPKRVSSTTQHRSALSSTPSDPQTPLSLSASPLVRGVAAAAAADVAGVVTLRATPPPALSPPFLLRPSSLLCERQVLLLMSLSVLRTPAIQKWCVSKIRSACCRCREAVSASGLGHAMVRVLFALSFLVSSSRHFLRDVCIDLERQFLLYPLEFVAGDLPVGHITVGRLGH